MKEKGYISNNRKKSETQQVPHGNAAYLGALHAINKRPRVKRVQKGVIMNLKNRCLPISADSVVRNAGGLKYPLCLAMLMLLCANSWAQNTSQKIALSPDEAVQLAIKNNLSLESSRVSLETSKRASGLSWNQFIPSVDVGAALFRLNNAPEVMTLDLSKLSPIFVGSPPIPMGGGGPQWRLSTSLSLSLNFNVAMIEDMHKLKLDYEKGLISYEKAKIQLERDVRKAYHNMLLLQENIALLRGNFENANRQVQMAQANYNAGLAPELTLLQARVARENLRPVIDQAENGLKLSMAQFAMSLGMDYDTQYALAPVTGSFDIILLDIADMISKAAAGKPEIQELRQEILSLNSTRKSTTLKLFSPNISFSWNADPSFGGDPLKDSWFDFDSWKQQQGMFRVTLGFRLNGLLPFGTERQGLRKLEDGIRNATIGLAQAINGTEIEIYNTILSLERTRINTEALAQTVTLAEQSYRLTEQAYRAGLQDYFQVQNAQQSLNQARVQVLEQQFNYLNSLIDLEYSIGVPFGTLSKRSR